MALSEAGLEPSRQIRIGLLAMAIIYTSAIAGYVGLCGWSLADAVYMIVITVSTVGYGEISHQTGLDRVISSYVILLGIAATVFTFGGLARLLVAGEFDRLLSRQHQKFMIDQLSGHHIICGFGRMGRMICESLAHRNEAFVLIELESLRMSQADQAGFLCVQGDASDEATLLRAGILRAKSVVCVLPSDAQNVFVTLTARNMNPRLFITARSEQPSTDRKLRQAGADRVVSPHVIGAERISRLLTRPTTVEVLEVVSGDRSVDLELDELIVPATVDTSRTIADADIRVRTGVAIVGVKRVDGQILVNPGGDIQLKPGDILVVFGKREGIDQVSQLLAGGKAKEGAST